MIKIILRSIIRILLRLISKIEIINKETLPKTGSYAFATNHLGILDALLPYYILDRWDFFIPVAEKWGESPILRCMAKYLNIIFIDRFHPDIRALRQILKRMEEGQVIIIAPEGTRSKSEKLAEGKPGVSYLASKSQFPVIPVALAGTEDRVFFDNLKHFRRTKITVTIGDAFTLPPLPRKGKDAFLKESTDEIMCNIAVMLPEKYRGFYAEHPKLLALEATKRHEGIQN